MALMIEARALTDRWASLSERIFGGRSRPEGTLRVIGPSGYGTGFLTDAVTDLHAAWPQLRNELTLTDRVVDLVASGAECWVCVGEVRGPTQPAHPSGVRYFRDRGGQAPRGGAKQHSQEPKGRCTAAAMYPGVAYIRRSGMNDSENGSGL